MAPIPLSTFKSPIKTTTTNNKYDSGSHNKPNVEEFRSIFTLQKKNLHDDGSSTVQRMLKGASAVEPTIQGPFVKGCLNVVG